MSTLIQQNLDHIYLTNAMIEDCGHVGPRRLESLGLKHGWINKEKDKVFDKKQDNMTFFPLTSEEADFPNVHEFFTGEGYLGIAGYTTLYQGQKWLSPAVDIEWLTEEKIREGYKVNDMHAATSAEALLMAQALMERATSRLSRIRGYAEIEDFDAFKQSSGDIPSAEGKWRVIMHIPMQWACDNLLAFNCSYECYLGFLRGITL